MHRLHNVNITGEHLVWNDRENIYYIGPDSIFRDSYIDIAVSARGLILVRTRFINCTIRIRRQLTDFPLHSAYFENCHLKGCFSGCDFGRNEAYANLSSYYPEAGIVNTDLSAAKLYGCRFINCDLSTLKLPRWPCFFLCDVDAVREQARTLPWPGLTYTILGDPGSDPPGTVAIAWDARKLSKQDRVPEAALKAVVEQIPGVIM